MLFFKKKNYFVNSGKITIDFWKRCNRLNKTPTISLYIYMCIYVYIYI